MARLWQPLQQQGRWLDGLEFSVPSYAGIAFGGGTPAVHALVTVSEDLTWDDACRPTSRSSDTPAWVLARPRRVALRPSRTGRTAGCTGACPIPPLHAVLRSDGGSSRRAPGEDNKFVASDAFYGRRPLHHTTPHHASLFEFPEPIQIPSRMVAFANGRGASRRDVASLCDSGMSSLAREVPAASRMDADCSLPGFRQPRGDPMRCVAMIRAKPRTPGRPHAHVPVYCLFVRACVGADLAWACAARQATLNSNARTDVRRYHAKK